MAQSTTTSTAGAGAAAVLFLIFLVIFLFYVACYWVIFTKAGEAGWKALIPFYNFYVACKIVGRPGWLWLVILIPFVGGLIFSIIISIDMAKSFGRSTGFAVGLILLSPVFVPILAFGPAQYLGPAAAGPGYGPPGGGYGGYPPPGGGYPGYPPQQYPPPPPPQGGGYPPPPPGGWTGR